MAEEVKPVETVKPVEAKPEVKNEVDTTVILQRLEKLEKDNKDYQRVISKKDEEVKQLRTNLESREEEINLNKALLGIVASQTGRSEEDILQVAQSNQPNLIKQVEKIQQDNEAKRRQRDVANKIDDIQRKVTDAGITEKDEDYFDIRDLALAGQFERAELRLNKLIAKKQVVEVKTPEPPKLDEKELEKQIEERVRKRMEEQGLLKTETGNVSGGQGRTYTMSEVIAMEGSEYLKNFPNGMPDITKAVQEGKIKI